MRTLEDVQGDIDEIERLQEKLSDMNDYLDKRWEALIIERARLETDNEDD